MLFDRLLALVAPHVCIGCGGLGSVLCRSCAEMVQTVPPRCYRCGKTSKLFATCRACRSQVALKNVFVWADYTDVPKAVIHTLKYERAAQAAYDLAAALPLPADFLKIGTVLVPVPTTPSRVRQRGYDQAVLLAKALGHSNNLPVEPILRRVGNQHQVGATARLRRAQMQGAFVAKTCPRTVILVDDVLTTGATLEAAAQALKKAGAKTVSAIVIAQA